MCLSPLYLRTAFLCLLPLLPHATTATHYRIGPGQPYAQLGDIPWTTLQPGDTVSIYWRSTPYAEKIFLRVHGTPTNPIVIRGVPNAAGQLPIITGENATTHPQFKGYFDSIWNEDLGLFLIARGPNDPYSYNPHHITFEYLQLTGVKPSNTFTNQNGNQRHYNSFSSAIHALIVDDLIVRHCIIHDNAQAIFTNSYGPSEEEVSRNTLIEYNRIYNNGNANADGTEHNIYIQSANTTIQYNFFGSPRAGSYGANIKDRSSGTVIRYNWIEGAARLLDLVETEGAEDILMNEPDYHDVYVYGNVFTNYLKQDPFGGNMIHFGFDNSPDVAKRGNLYFYFNTVYIEGDETDWWNTRLFDVTDDNDSTTQEGTVHMYNNIVHKAGTTHLQMMRDGGTLVYHANNWIVEGYEDLAYGATATIDTLTPPMTGTSPHFVDIPSENFHLASNSPCIDSASPLPQHLLQKHPIEYQYVKHASREVRFTYGAAKDLGAFERAAPLRTHHPPLIAARPHPHGVHLSWLYPSPLPIADQSLLRSSDLLRWDTLAHLPPQPHLGPYHYIDDQPLHGRSYYRLAAHLNDGTTILTSIATYYLSDPAISIYPNPAVHHITIRSPQPITEVLLISSDGTVIEQFEPTPTIDIRHLPSGLHTLLISTTTHSTIISFVKP